MLYLRHGTWRMLYLRHGTWRMLYLRHVLGECCILDTDKYNHEQMYSIINISNGNKNVDIKFYSNKSQGT
jgi:hypothetical protein